MSNQIYYSSAYGGGGVGGYSLRVADPYPPAAMNSTRYSTEALAYADASSQPLNHPHELQHPSVGVGSYAVAKIGAGQAPISWHGIEGFGDAASKRNAEALYHQSILAHNTIGQSDALLPTYSLIKRPRVVGASHLPIYPQRPGEKDCAHYMMTRTCKFGEACRFDHPIWVPEGGIPDWKEVPLIPATESLPERPGESDCPYFMKTQKCKYGSNCKFNHPKEKIYSSLSVESNGILVNSGLPERPTEPVCAFYAKTGNCKFGGTCKFHHPKEILTQSAANDFGATAKIESVINTVVPFTPALWHNSKGLPIRPGETECPFYLKTGSCKFGTTCRYSHPDKYLFSTPGTSNMSNAIVTPTASSFPIGVMNSASSLIPTLDPHFTQLGVGAPIYPQRPGEIECDHYMKTGLCKFAERCRFHHPTDRSAAPIESSIKQQTQLSVKLSLAGLPRREGSVACPFYMKTATCKYGAMCRFDHPPPGEAVALANVQENEENNPMPENKAAQV